MIQSPIVCRWCHHYHHGHHPLQHRHYGIKSLETLYYLKYVHMNHQYNLGKHIGFTTSPSLSSKSSFHHRRLCNVFYHKFDISTGIKIKIISL